jgi:hypothetical protein
MRATNHDSTSAPVFSVVVIDLALFLAAGVRQFRNRLHRLTTEAR